MKNTSHFSPPCLLAYLLLSLPVGAQTSTLGGAFAGSAGVPALQTNVLDFDSVDASTNVVDATAYLAAYGVTVGGLTPGTEVYIQSDLDYYGSAGLVFASSPPNYLTASTGNPSSFTLNFAVPLTSVAFTRITETGGPGYSGNSYGAWSAEVLAGTNQIAQVGESAFSVFGPGEVDAAKIYSFTGPGITSIIFGGNNYGFYGSGAIFMDDLTLVAPAGPPIIITQPTNEVAAMGGNVDFEVTAAGLSPLSYQWSKNSVPIADDARVRGATTSTLAIQNLTTKDAGTYSVAISNSLGLLTSSNVTLQIVPPPTLTITTPKANEQVTSSFLTINGKAADRVAVAAVYYQLDGGTWTLAQSRNGWTNWNANIILTDGPHQILAFAIDITGNVSRTNRVSFKCKTGIEIASLSTTNAAPFTLLQINASGLTTNTPVFVQFYSSAGLVADVPPVQISSGSLTVPVPPLLSQEGVITDGLLYAIIVQSKGDVQAMSAPSTAIQVQSVAASAVPPGTLTLSYLEATYDTATNILAALPGSDIDSDKIESALTNEISLLQVLISNVQHVVQNPDFSFSLGTISNQSLLIGQTELQACDNLLVANLLAISTGIPTDNSRLRLPDGGQDSCLSSAAGNLAQSAQNRNPDIDLIPGAQEVLSGGYQNILCAVPQAFKTSLTVVAGGAGVGIGLFLVGVPAATAATVALPTAAILYVTVAESGGIIALGGALGQTSPAAKQLVTDGMAQLEELKWALLKPLAGHTGGGLLSALVGTHALVGAFASPGSSLNYYTLTIITSTGTGTGTVSADPPGLEYPNGTKVTLTASPGSDSIFGGWSGDATGSALSVKITMNGNESVTATFNSTPPTTVEGHTMTSVSGTKAGCTTPPADYTFPPTAADAVSWILIDDVQAGSSVTWNWYRPDGTFYTSATIKFGTAGSYCEAEPLHINGYVPASVPGTWSVEVSYDQTNLLYTESFQVTGKGNCLGTATVNPCGPCDSVADCGGEGPDNGCWTGSIPPFCGDVVPALRTLDELINASSSLGYFTPDGRYLEPDTLLTNQFGSARQYYVVTGGKITDIFLDHDGFVQSIAMDGGKVVAWNQEGQPVTSTLPTQVSLTLGNFSGSPASAALVKQGGAIKGLVLDSGRVRAILGDISPLPGGSSPPPKAALTQPSIITVEP